MTLKEKLVPALLFASLFFTAGIQGQQPARLTDKFFPDPHVTLYTPAFESGNGFTSYDQMISFIRTTMQGHEDICSLSFIGKSQNGVDIPMITLRRNNGQPKTRAVIEARLHGDEPASTEGVLHLFYQLLNDPAVSYLLDKVDLALLPMANVDGAEKMQRVSANGLDLNRDLTKLAAPETVILKQAINSFEPDLFIDMHEFNPTRNDYGKMGSFGLTVYFDAMFLYSSNLNVPTPVRKITQDLFVPKAAELLANHGFRTHVYFTTSRSRGQIYFNLGGSSPRSTSTSYALTNAVSILMEVRGVGIKRTSLARRTYTTYLLAVSYLTTAYRHGPELRAAIQQGIRARNKVVVTRNAPVDTLTIPFIDIQKNEVVNEKVWARKTIANTAGIQRARPFAYIIMPDQTILATKLRQLGLKLDSLPAAIELPVEAFTISSYRESADKFEGAYEQIVRAKATRRQIRFPAGSFVVRMDQRNAALAAVTLEPEAENGFIRYNVLPVKKGIELPIYRLMKGPLTTP